MDIQGAVMSGSSKREDNRRLVLGLPSLVAVIVGIAVSQVGLVGVLQGVGLSGSAPMWLVAIAFSIAFLLALTYVASFSELALMMPSAGGLGTYTEVAIGHFPALVATFAGYVVVNMFGLPAELIIFDSLIREVFGLAMPSNLMALALLAVLTVLNIRGTDIFAALQNSSTALKVALMLATGIAVLFVSPISAINEAAAPPDLSSIELVAASVALFFWCFVAAEFVCPMIEEVRSPSRNIPLSMLLGVLLLALLYALYAYGASRVLARESLVASTFPHLAYAQAVFGKLGVAVLVVFATTATIGLINGILAGVSRMLFGMARNGQAFPVFARLHPKYGTPWVAIIFMATLCGVPLLLLGNSPSTVMTLVVSASTCWLFAYIVVHVDLIVLRQRYPDAVRPFRSPLFPLPQVCGVLGMGWVIATSPKDVLLGAGGMIVAVGLLSALWVKFAMNRGLFAPVPLVEANPR